MRYKQRFRRATVSPAAFLRRHHRQSAYRMAHAHTRRLQQNGFRWYRVEMRKAVREAGGWGLGAGRTERQGDKS